MSQLNEIPKSKPTFFNFIIFSILVILSVKYSTNPFSPVLTAVTVYMFASKLSSFLLKKNFNDFIRKTSKLRTNHPNDFEEKAETLKKHRGKRVKQIPVLVIVLILILSILMNYAYALDSIFLKAFFFTNLISLYFLLEKKHQYEDVFQKILIKN